MNNSIHRVFDCISNYIFQSLSNEELKILRKWKEQSLAAWISSKAIQGLAARGVCCLMDHGIAERKFSEDFTSTEDRYHVDGSLNLVFQALAREMFYSKSRWNDEDLNNDLPAWMLIMESELHKSAEAWLNKTKDETLLAILQLVSVCVACMEKNCCHDK